MTKWYKSMRDTIDIQIFPTIDTHWDFSAVYGFDSLFRFMNELNDFGIPKIKYGEPIKGNKKDRQTSLSLYQIPYTTLL